MNSELHQFLGHGVDLLGVHQNVVRREQLGDARAMALPLIGGLDPERYHDWREIFTRWGMLELDTAWAVVEVEKPNVAWYDPKIQLRCGTKRIELGRFLTGEEKHQLAEQLKSAIKKHSAL